MFNDVIECSLSASSGSAEPVSVTHTVVVPCQSFVAQTSLAKVSGRGSAQAFIREYCFQSWEMIDCQEASKAERAPSIIKVNHAYSVTFELRVKNASASATGLVFLNTAHTPSIGVRYDFNQGDQGWTAGFADLPPNQEDFFELQAGIRELPRELGQSGRGFFISGNNHSDDLFMFLKRRLGPGEGIQPNQEYKLTYGIVFASNAPTGCVGVGGAPGEAVVLKAGGSPIEPLPVLEEDGVLRMNVDKGNQSKGGPAGAVISNIANGIPCEAARKQGNPYVLVTRMQTSPYPVTSSREGELWLTVGTDSGFEATTALYYQQIAVLLQPWGTSRS